MYLHKTVLIMGKQRFVSDCVNPVPLHGEQQSFYLFVRQKY